MGKTIYLVDAKGKGKYSFHEFWNDIEGKIRKDYYHFFVIFGVKYDEINLYYKVSKDNQTYTYFGVSTVVDGNVEVLPRDNCSEEEVDAFMRKRNMKCMTVEDYMAYRRDIARRKKDEMREERKRRIQERNYEWDCDIEKKDNLPPRKYLYSYKVLKWIEKVSYTDFVNEITDRVKGQADVEIFVANVYNYLDNIAHERPCNNNAIICAPSGSGKTETFRAIRDYFKKHLPDMPVSQIDMTSITEEGFSGKNTIDVVQDLFANYSTQGIGIVFMDEFDKKIIPSYSKGGSNVNAAVQAQILTLIEGRIVRNQKIEINTENTMFVGLGSFDACRNHKKEEATHTLGFVDNTEEISHYEDITRDDMINLGASFELLGRFPLVLNYKKISHKVIDAILDEKVQKLEQSYDCIIQVSEELRQELHACANSEYGCRGFDSMLMQNILPAYTYMLKNNLNRAECTVVLYNDKFRLKQKMEYKQEIVG